MPKTMPDSVADEWFRDLAACSEKSITERVFDAVHDAAVAASKSKSVSDLATCRDVADALGFSRAHIGEVLRRLKEAGRVVQIGRSFRSRYAPAPKAKT